MKPIAVQLIDARTGETFAASIGGRLQAGRSLRQIGADFGLGHTTIWRHWQAQCGKTLPLAPPPDR